MSNCPESVKFPDVCGTNFAVKTKKKNNILDTYKTKKNRDFGCLEPNYAHLEFYTRAGNREIFATRGPQNTTQVRKIAQGFFPIAIFNVHFLLSRVKIPGRQDWKRPGQHVPTHTRLPSPRCHPIITAATWTSSDGREDGVEYTQQVGAPVAGEGRMLEMPGFRSTTTTSSAPPRWICDGVEVCPNPATSE